MAKITDEVRARIIKAYLLDVDKSNGSLPSPQDEWARRFGLRGSTVKNVLVKAGVFVTPKSDGGMTIRRW